MFEVIQTAEKPGLELHVAADKIVPRSSWPENLAKCVLDTVEKAIREGVSMGPALKEAFDRAVDAAVGFARDHPVYTTIIAIGILVLLLPWVVEALGFAELGPVEGNIPLSCDASRTDMLMWTP